MSLRNADRNRIELLHQLTDVEWGRAAIDSLVTGFADQYPDWSLEQSVVSGSNLSLRIKSRILREQAPDVWVEWPGRNMEPYVKAGTVADISETWAANNFEDAFSDAACEATCFDGSYYAVPLNVHRINNLFYRPTLLETAGVDPHADTPREFVELLEQMNDVVDCTPFVMGLRNPEWAIHIWETVLLGQSDPQTYDAIVSGRPGPHRSTIETALSVFTDLLALASDRATFDSLPDANGRFIDGEGAFFLMGDWAASAYDTDGYGEQWNAIAFPGTESLYPLNMDALIPGAQSDRSEAMTSLLTYAGSRQAQKEFNAHKGSISPRSDVQPAQGSPFLRDQQRDFERARAYPQSIAHGLAVDPQHLIELKSVMAEFVADPDPTAAADAIVDALQG